MVENILILFAELCILAGAIFTLIGAIGMLRMPDFFSRTHPVGLKDSIGLPLIILGLVLHSGFELTSLKLLFLMLFVLFTSPVASHALAKAALMIERNHHSKASRGAEDASRNEEPR